MIQHVIDVGEGHSSSQGRTTKSDDVQHQRHALQEAPWMDLVLVFVIGLICRFLSLLYQT